ncbi:dethiobiotin synthase [Rossellomorea aquimaris]|nr:dethiobiotin synthase [Rossellomorea aquimaris]WRP07759.1 dethiobiotin synthase [Rossellomorea aquimaris]
MKGFFITGTDTDIGKTVTTGLLTKYFLENGIDAFPYKPVQSGAILKKDRLVAPDTEFYEVVTTRSFGKDANTYLLKTPSSPHLAASIDGVRIELKPILEQVEKLQSTHELLLVEGAGGLIVPLNQEETILDLIERVSLPVILVARTGLGTINHTVLSVMALKQRNIEIAGIILNQTSIDEMPEIERDNKRMIEILTGIKVIGVLPYIIQNSFEKIDVHELLKNWKLEKLEGDG